MLDYFGNLRNRYEGGPDAEKLVLFIFRCLMRVGRRSSAVASTEELVDEDIWKRSHRVHFRFEGHVVRIILEEK